MLVVGDVADDRLAVPGSRPQPLVPAAGIARDHRVRRGQDRLGGPVVLLQQDCSGVREVPLELLNVADRGAPEGVNGLVGVAHHAQLGGIGVRRHWPHQFPDQHILRMIGVLVLVDQDVAKPAPGMLGNVREGLPTAQRYA